MSLPWTVNRIKEPTLLPNLHVGRRAPVECVFLSRVPCHYLADSVCGRGSFSPSKPGPDVDAEAVAVFLAALESTSRLSFNLAARDVTCSPRILEKKRRVPPA